MVTITIPAMAHVSEIIFTFVTSAEGHLASLMHLECQRKSLETINLGTWQEHKCFLELISAFENATGVEIQFRFTMRREGDAPTCYALHLRKHTIF